jgi:hypothetical protein
MLFAQCEYFLLVGLVGRAIDKVGYSGQLGSSEGENNPNTHEGPKGRNQKYDTA